MLSFNDLYSGWIVGIIDSYGAVHSKFCPLYGKGITDGGLKTHEELFPRNIMKRWRWSYSDGINQSSLSSDLDVEDWDKIQRHITRKFRIPFWGNGYHDIDFFMSKMDEEDKLEEGK